MVRQHYQRWLYSYNYYTNTTIHESNATRGDAGEHDEYVFEYRGRPIETMNNDGWQEARKRAGLTRVHVHDLKHTFGRRLRAAGVSFENRQDLLGHRSGRITTHCSAAELANLIDAANKVCDAGPAKLPHS